MMTTETERRAWVGCLSCYNAGRLTGAWLDAEACGGPLRETAPELAEVGYYRPGNFIPGVSISPEMYDRFRGVHDRCRVCGGDEWWVMDTEGMPAAWSVESSPETFAERAGMLDQIESDSYDVDAFGAYMDYVGVDYATVEGFEDAYCGHFDDGAAYAEELAEDVCAVPDEARSTWPLYCIDWERAWRELEFGGDNYSIDCPTGGVYIFRAS